MEEKDRKNKAVKLTVTFADGHTEDFDTFITSVAMGLTPIGKDEDGSVVYIAEENKFQTQGILHINGTADVIAGLINTFMSMIENLVPSDPNASMQLLQALITLRSNTTEKYIRNEAKKINPNNN